MKAPLNPTSLKGFTLTEIAITLGILGVVLLPMVGLLGVASRANYNADTISISASIASDLQSRAQQADWEQVSQWESRAETYYFDFEGVEIDEQANSAFTAQLQIETPNLNLGAGIHSDFIKKAMVVISSRSGNEGESDIDAYLRNEPTSSVISFTTILVKAEK